MSNLNIIKTKKQKQTKKNQQKKQNKGGKTKHTITSKGKQTKLSCINMTTKTMLLEYVLFLSDKDS